MYESNVKRNINQNIVIVLTMYWCFHEKIDVKHLRRIHLLVSICTFASFRMNKKYTAVLQINQLWTLFKLTFNQTIPLGHFCDSISWLWTAFPGYLWFYSYIFYPFSGRYLDGIDSYRKWHPTTFLAYKYRFHQLFQCASTCSEDRLSNSAYRE